VKAEGQLLPENHVLLLNGQETCNVYNIECVLNAC
jgi:hypothetical protein